MARSCCARNRIDIRKRADNSGENIVMVRNGGRRWMHERAGVVVNGEGGGLDKIYHSQLDKRTRN